VLLPTCFAPHLLAQTDAETRQMILEQLMIDAENWKNQGNVDIVVQKYETALKVEKGYLPAVEALMPIYMSQKEYTKLNDLCEKMLSLYDDSEKLGNVYVAYGACLEALGKRDDAINMYQRGIRYAPKHYPLYYNQAIMFMESGEWEFVEGLLQKTVVIEPRIPEAHKFLGMIHYNKGNRIPALLAWARYLILEPEGKDAAVVLEAFNALLDGSPYIDKDSTVIMISPELVEMQWQERSRTHDFYAVDLAYSVMLTQLVEPISKRQTPPNTLLPKMGALLHLLQFEYDKHWGFYWDYYVPYYIKMDEKGLLGTFCHILYVHTRKTYIDQWIQDNRNDFEAFYQWSERYPWPRNLQIR